MTKEVLAIDANDTLDVIAGLFEKYNYDGMPVVDTSKKLLGMITGYDLVLQSSDIHLPTLIRLMDQVARDKGDRKIIDAHFAKLKDIKATAMMNPNPMSITADAPLEEAAHIFADHRKVNPLCVVDATGLLVGVLSRYDIIKFFNQSYLRRVVQEAEASGEAFRSFPTKSEHEVEDAVEKVQRDFLIVSKRRPMIWRYIAIGAFFAGLLAATALIIRIVQRGG